MSAPTPQRHWTEAFARREEAGRRGEPAWLHAARKAALARFAELGFPSRKLEAWKYTNVAPLAKIPFEPARTARAPGLPDTEHLPVPLGHAERLVFVNGRRAPELCRVEDLDPRVTVEGLARVLDSDPGRLEGVLGRLDPEAGGAFAALNLAFFTDGALVHVPRGVTLEEPVHLAFLTLAAGKPVATHPRVLVVAEPGSRVTVVELHAALGHGVYFTNAATEIRVGENATVEHVKLQDESREAFHVALLQARQERASRFVSHSLSFGAHLARVDVEASLAGEGAECALNGLYVATDDQHVDHHTWIDHETPHGTSRELYKGVLGGSARGVFDGHVLVRPEAQKTDARQRNENLLLSPDADVNTKPVLEIHADDVKCAHGSTVGRLDPDALFYLRSRGLDDVHARGLLTRGFAAGVTREIGDDLLRSAVEALVVRRLFGPQERGAGP